MATLGVPCAERLYTLCIKAVVNQLAAICDKKSTPIPRSMRKPADQEDDEDAFINIDLYSFKDQGIKLNEQISQDLFVYLCQTGLLNNLSIGVFTNSQTNLRTVMVKGATLSLQVLRYVLIQHNIVHFAIDNMQVESINQVIECHNE